MEDKDEDTKAADRDTDCFIVANGRHTGEYGSSMKNGKNPNAHSKRTTTITTATIITKENRFHSNLNKQAELEAKQVLVEMEAKIAKGKKKR